MKEVKPISRPAEVIDIIFNYDYIDDYGVDLYIPIEEDQHLKTLDHIWYFNRRITD